MIVYGRSNGKALRSALNSVTEVRNGYIYAAATGERIAKIGNTITGSAYMDCQRPGKSVEKLSKL